MEGREIDVIARKQITYSTVKYTFDWSSVGVGDWFIMKGGSQAKAATKSLRHSAATKHWRFDVEPFGRVSKKFVRIA